MPPRPRGVRFDIGHGCGSFAWSTADAGAGRGAPARRDQHRPPSLLDRTPGRRPADDDVALPRAGHVAGGGRHRDDRGSGRDPRAAGAGHVARRWSRPTSPSSRRTPSPGDLPDAEGVRRSVEPDAAAGLDDRGRRAPRAARRRVTLRPLLDADREVDCTRPDLTGRRTAGSTTSGPVPQSEPVELGPADCGRIAVQDDRRDHPSRAGPRPDSRRRCRARGARPARRRTADRRTSRSRRRPRLTLRLTPRRAGSSSR